MCTRTTDPNDTNKRHFRTTVIIMIKPNHSVSNCFRKQGEDTKENGILNLGRNQL